MKPSWYENAALRAQTPDAMGKWCARAIAAIDAGADALHVTPEEYGDLRLALGNEERRNPAYDLGFYGAPVGPPLDSLPVVVDFDRPSSGDPK
jgi:hypothetical protein